MNGFDPSQYGPDIASLLHRDTPPELGPGKPDRRVEGRLRSLSPADLFSRRRIVDTDMARACLAGLWLFHDFLDESHTISQEIHTATGWLYEQGHSVILADCDSQQSSSEWIREAAPEVRAVRLDNPDMILNELPTLAQEADFVVADGPGSQTETSRALLLRADLAVVPCKASMLEVRALAKATEVLRQAQDIRNGIPKAVIVLSMVGKNYRLTQDMKDAAAALHLPMADTHLILRQIYADAPGQGSVVRSLRSRAREAASEVDTLFREILPNSYRGKAARAEFAARKVTAG